MTSLRGIYLRHATSPIAWSCHSRSLLLRLRSRQKSRR